MVYTDENSFIVNNVKNLIEAKGINTFLKHEFSQGAVGELSPLDSWPEVWVFDDADVERALEVVEVVEVSQRSHDAVDWTCKHCSEQNDPSFEICWQCLRGSS